MARKKRVTATAGLDLALQGGGSHGAFTWGVLDRLLEDDSIAIDGVSGTSAGALNAAVMATGWADGGRAGARDALRHFWRDVAGVRGCFGAGPAGHWRDWAALNPFMAATPLSAFNLEQLPGYTWFNAMLGQASPYQFNPVGPNPLREVLARHVRVEAMQRGPMKLFVAATAVQTGQPRIFSGADLSIDALLASACLPQMFKAIEIDGQPYWDGGYSGNPALWPLIYETPAMDILLVRIDPLLRPGTPQSAAEIQDRINEITFNATLAAEMRAIRFVERLLREKRVDAGHYKSLRLHMVADDEGLAPLSASSKLNTDLGLLQRLHTLGHAAADRWLIAHRADVGRRSSFDISGTFLEPRRVD